MHLSNKTTQEIILFLITVHSGKYKYLDIPDKIQCLTKIKIEGPIHGEFIQRIQRHADGHGCGRCNNSFYKSTKFFINELFLLHGNRFDYSKIKYVNSKTPIILICKYHGEFKVRPCTALKSKVVCIKCINREVWDTKSFIEKSIKIHGDVYDYSSVYYKNAKTKVKIICRKHGVFEQTPDTHFNSNGCKKCFVNSSKIERDWLVSLNIQTLNYNHYIKINKQYKFHVDGFDPATNTVYEFNGDYFHGNPKYFRPLDINRTSRQSFGELYRKTEEKRIVLENAGYKVVSIWESEWYKQN